MTSAGFMSMDILYILYITLCKALKQNQTYFKLYTILFHYYNKNAVLLNAELLHHLLVVSQRRHGAQERKVLLSCLVVKDKLTSAVTIIISSL